MDKELIDLVNPEIDFSFAGKIYKVKKANVKKALSYQQKIKELTDNNSIGIDLLLVSHCIYLCLKDSDSTITEDWVQSNTPGDIDVAEVLTTLGFMNPKQRERLQKVQDKILEK